MRLRSLAVLVASVSVIVSVQADEKKGKQENAKPAVARGNVVGEVVCAKCEFDAAEVCTSAIKLSENQFVLVAGKAADTLFDCKGTGKIVRVSGALTLKDGVLTVTSKKMNEVKGKEVKPQLTLVGKLVRTKCEFKVGEECGVGLKSGELQVVLAGDAAKALFKDRCSGKPKTAIGALTKIDGKILHLKAAKIVDPKAAVSDKKQPAKSENSKST